MMRESEFFNESDVQKTADLNCPFCRQTFGYQVRWRQRIKKKTLPGSASSEDRQRFAKARSYLVRIDDRVRCQNPRCAKRFEIGSLQTVAFLSEAADPSADHRRFRGTRNAPKRRNNSR